MSNEEDDGGRDDITKNFKTQFRSVLQNISGIMIPLILLANIDISKLMVAIMPSLVTLIFLVYDYYQETVIIINH